MKENELQYLKKEVQCLRDELQVIQKVGSTSMGLGMLQVPEPAAIGHGLTLGLPLSRYRRGNILRKEGCDSSKACFQSCKVL